MPTPGSRTIIGRMVERTGMVVIAATVIACSTPSAPAASEAAVSASPSVVEAATTPSARPTPSAAPTGGTGVGTPPDAALAVDGGDPVEGQLGTYVWADGGSDSPWLPGAPVAAATGEILGLTLSPDLGISDWSAALAPASSLDGTGRIQVGSGTGPGPVRIPTPDPGAWTLAVTIRFGDLGSATWFWRLDVM